jgi:hypothetical protein
MPQMARLSISRLGRLKSECTSHSYKLPSSQTSDLGVLKEGPDSSDLESDNSSGCVFESVLEQVIPGGLNPGRLHDH